MNALRIAQDFAFMAKLHKAEIIRFELNSAALISAEANIGDFRNAAAIPTQTDSLFGHPLKVIHSRSTTLVVRLICKGLTLEASE